MRIRATEWYPVYVPDEYKDPWYDAEIPEELARRLTASIREFEEIQDEIGVLVDAAQAKKRAEEQRVRDAMFVLGARPWWSQARCEALVESRRRSGKPLRRLTPS